MQDRRLVQTVQQLVWSFTGAVLGQVALMPVCAMTGASEVQTCRPRILGIVADEAVAVLVVDHGDMLLLVCL